MVGVLGLMVALWAGGAALRLPVRLRLGLIAALWAVVVLLNLTLPEGAPLRAATGGSAQVWLVLAGLVALVLAYRALLARLRASAAPQEPAAGGGFRAAELDRYARHILLREIGGPGQGRLKAARVLVIGAGGLGAPALLYLAAAGVGRIAVIDDDTVENSNLQRQVIHTDARIGMTKTASATEAIRALNPFVEVRSYTRRLDRDSVQLIGEHDLILDGSDNFDTRYLVNEACVVAGKPLISGAITQWEGQLSLFHPAAGGPCYACVFPQRPAPGLVPTCAEAGVVAALPGVIGSMMAMEAIKHLTGAGETLRGRLMIHDALHAETRTIRTKARPGCPVCKA